MCEEQFMIEFVLDYLARYDHHGKTREELNALRGGVQLFLRDYGIPRSESQPFYQEYAQQLLAKVAPRDLKDYFLHYEAIHAVRNELLNHNEPGPLPVESRLTCLLALERIAEHPGLEKYIPVAALQRKINLRL